MLFNSISFAIFLPSVFALYWFAAGRNYRTQNIILLASSYFFYAFWDYRFLSLLILSTLLGFIAGIKIYEAETLKNRRAWLWFSVSANLGILGIFKYYGFFAKSLAQALSLLGIHASPWALDLVLPVGISFYTFHGLSYILDVYNRRINPVRNLVEYSVFVSFFPLLVAGPIERATHLLPQIQAERQFDYSNAVDGLRQILWGLFKKIVIADGCAEYANMIFNNADNFSGSTLAMGALFFSIQIYCDFSGYSDIAIGTSRLFGIELLRNFAFPYFSRNIAEFWRRWHISLSSWFRDYAFFPLERRRGSAIRQPVNILIVFFLTGLWHGANWTFIVWGLLHGLYLVLNSLLTRIGIRGDDPDRLPRLPGLILFLEMLSTFLLVSFTWVFFRAKDLGQAMNYISGLFSASLFQVPEIPAKSLMMIALIVIFLLIEWMGREQQYAIANLGLAWPKPLRFLLYYAIIFTIFYFAGPEQQFIYFQF